MAEIVGLTASIAGLVALTCQIGKSVLFIKGFLEDTKNAPEDIRSLASEIDLLCSAAKTTDTLLVKCQAEGLDMDFEEEHKGLTRYADMIEKLKAKIEKDVTTFGSGKGLWWERVGSAARKKSVEGYLRGVERAKTLVLDIEAKIMIQLQLHHRDSLITTNKSLGTLQVSSDRHTTTLNRMETQTTQISAWTGTTDQTLNTLSMEVQQISSSLNTFLPAIQTLQHQSTSQPELSALESMLESAVFRGMKRHHEEMQNSQPSSSHFHTPEIAGTGTNTALRNTNKSFDFGSHTMLRRDKTVFQTAFRTPLFDIDIQTKEVQWMPKRKRDTTVHEVFQVKPSRSQRFTTYAVRVKIPFWRGGMTYHSGNAGMMYGGSLCKTFRTYNIVPWNAPIIAACERFDLPEVRRLFEAGLASPFDCHMDVTLVDTVLLSFTELPNQYLNAQAAINLLEYLICCCGGDIGRVRMLYQIFSRVAIRSFSEQDITSLAEAARLIFGHCSEDPTNGLETFLTIHVSRTPLFQALIRQDV
ncbi:hypothetical protein BKA64DRAFT_145402 [Cadophora sp. MPI-SDFR-AT-0126]|nr:hypothetical protein BKA64DRAFT_145402 [Leotiomycetes sp. MPI-SDFR-AT-0126]